MKMELYSERAIKIINELHTERLDYESEYVPLIDAANALKEFEGLGTAEELAALKQAQSEGRLYIAPCPDGTPIYYLPEDEMIDLEMFESGEILSDTYVHGYTLSTLPLKITFGNADSIFATASSNFFLFTSMSTVMERVLSVLLLITFHLQYSFAS